MNELTGVLPSHLTEWDETPRAAKQGMGKDDFMKLLMTQLRYQDPLNPMDQKDFSAQLAQFSSLEQLANIGGGIKNLRSGMGDEAKLQALGMIGKQVQASGSEIELSDGHPVAIKLDPSGDLEPVQVQIFSQGGKLVRDLPLDKNKAKSGEIEWDGKGPDGADLPSGKYSFVVHGVDKNGQAREMNPELQGVVTGVELAGSEAVLLIKTPAGQSKIELSKIHHVSIPETTRSGSVPNGNVLAMPVSAGNRAAPIPEPAETSQSEANDRMPGEVQRALLGLQDRDSAFPSQE